MEELKSQIRCPNPRGTANCLSALTFWWTLDFFKIGFRRDIEAEDLYAPLQEQKSDVLGDSFEKHWRKEVKSAYISNRNPSLLKVILKFFGVRIAACGLIQLLAEIFVRISQPIFLGRLIHYFRHEGDITRQEAYIYATAMVLCSVIVSMTLYPLTHEMYHLGLKMRVACGSLLYRKALRLSHTALCDSSAGQVVNLLSNDLNRFDAVVLFLHYLWIGPLELVVIAYFMWTQLDVAALAGVACLLVFIPVQGYLGRATSKLRLKTALRTDRRVRLINEFISGIQVIKLYAWEPYFTKLVHLARRIEIKSIKATAYIRCIIVSFGVFVTRFSIFVSILTYILLGEHITAEKVFVVTAYYNLLSDTMGDYFPKGIVLCAEGLVSIKRIQKFLMFEEIESCKIINESDGPTKKNSISSYVPEEDCGIDIMKASAKWFGGSDNTLTDINITVPSKKLVAVVGPVGSGKSSLLQTILRELPLCSGSLCIRGRLSYASQEPWLFASTLRQNIIFGEPFDRRHYRRVIKACALEQDFSMFPLGDKTLVGERGVTLSGGQKARINLARAVYRKADIYLLDDPLSAVDPHVGRHLFDACITGLLRNKTCVLVTHQLQFVKRVDSIVILNNGIVEAKGTYTDLQKTGLDFAKLLARESATADFSRIRGLTELLEESFQNRSHESMKSLDIEVASAPVSEMRTSGNVGNSVYKEYFKSGGNWCMRLIVALMFILTPIATSGTDYWVAHWTNVEEQRHSNFTNVMDSWLPRTYTCVYVYTGLVVSMIVITFARSFLFFIFSIKASSRLHNKMFDSVSSATMRFFNTNPSGRIINRLSKDMGSIDEKLPIAVIECFQIILIMLGVVINVAVVNFWLLLPTLALAFFGFLMRIAFLKTSSSVKRLEAITRSPVYNHLNASMQGLSTIRAFGAQYILGKEFDKHQDINTVAFYMFMSISRAFAFWLDIGCLFYIGLVTYSFLVFGEDMFGGSVGLAITQAISLTGTFQWGLRQSAELVNQMTSVERVLEFTEVEKEPVLEEIEYIKPPYLWPTEGEIVFNRVSLRYGKHDPPVLKNLSFTVKPKEKIGIVGRTGAGKSSIITALFRLADTHGSIIIDGIDTKFINITDFRKKISIIPQEPVLFSGTMRSNLDPYEEYSDAELWEAIEEVELREVINDMPARLNSQISAGGSNFSVGQRQLVCLARAIVRKNKILVLDEATANVDPGTDALIQKTIRKKFSECTVLTIAHRLHTVMDSDKVLVVDAGCVIEFDHPHILLQNERGLFHSMVQQTGRSMAEHLQVIAEENYKDYIQSSSSSTTSS